MPVSDKERIAQLEAQLGILGKPAVAGYARCVSLACERSGTDRQIPVQASTISTHAPELADMVVNSNVYVNAVNDGDLTCPDCGQPCALVNGPAPAYAPLAPR